MAIPTYTYPSDLINNPEYGQMMTFMAFTPESARVRAGINMLPQEIQGMLPPPAQMLDVFHIYVPGGGQNNLLWSQKHEYDEVKLARLGAAGAASAMGVPIGIGGSDASLAGGAFRKVINPVVEVLYRNTNLRSYTFSFMFAPERREDSVMLYGVQSGAGILNRFRYHAAPRNQTAYFDSPSEWEVSFYYRNTKGAWTVNRNLPRIAKGVLTQVEVDYNPDSEYSTFERGEPTSARLTLNFVEMEIIDKNRIEEGGF